MEFTIHSHFSSLSLSICLILYFLTFSLSLDKEEHSLPRLQSAYAALLVSKQVILFSIPVSAETVIICPLKRSHTLRHNAKKLCQRNCWGWFGRENYKWPFTTNREPPAAAAAHFSIPHSFCFVRNYRSIIYGGMLAWIYIVIRQGRL